MKKITMILSLFCAFLLVGCSSDGTIKVVNGYTGVSGTTYTIKKVEIKGPTNKTETVSLKYNQSKTYSGLKSGTYQVKFTDDAFILNTSQSPKFELSAGETKTVTYMSVTATVREAQAETEHNPIVVVE